MDIHLKKTDTLEMFHPDPTVKLHALERVSHPVDFLASGIFGAHYVNTAGTLLLPKAASRIRAVRNAKIRFPASFDTPPE
ncbi:MAG: hypothetical protein K9N10_10960 [Deltaproteobacteria bacterium]|nr:hypothetical protein [Deltaproteobacteria bacterium]